MSLLVLLCSCGSEAPVQLRIELPIDGSLYRGVILGVEVDGELTVHASEISFERTIDPIDVRFPLDGEVTITALLYFEGLLELGIPPGVLAREPEPQNQRLLPYAQGIQRLTIDEGAPSEWAEVDLGPPLDSYAITKPSPCAMLRADVVSLGAAGEPTFAMALDQQWALIGTSTRLLPGESPAVFFVNTSGAIVKQDGLPSSFFEGYREDGGTIWLGGERGVVYRGTFSATPMPHLDVVASSTVSSREDIIGLVGPPSGTPFEQFAMTSDRGIDEQWGAFEWFDGTTWRVPGLRRNTPHDATWVAPGYGLFASFYRDGTVYGVKDGAETEILVSSVVFGSVLEIERIPGLGLAAGTSGGEVHLQKDGGEWSVIAAKNTEEIKGIAPYPGGLVYLGGNSLIQYADPDVVCDEIGVDGRTLARSLAVIGSHVVVPVLDPDHGEDQVAERSVALIRQFVF